MNAVVFDGASRLHFDQSHPTPVRGPGQALIRVRFAGICGSDISHYQGKNPRARLPVVPGHEIFGRVAELPDAAAEHPLRPDDRVAVLPTMSCGNCDLCTSGRSHLCRSLRFIGVQENGGMADFVAAPVENLYRVPDGLSDEAAALTEPLAVALHAVRRASLRAGASVLVIGAGPIGLLVATAARLAGVSRLLVLEIAERRIAAAEAMGFETLRAAGTGSVAAPDVVFECTGHPSAVLPMIELAAFTARVVIVGAFKEPAAVDLFRFSRKELDLRGSFAYAPEDFAEAVTTLANSPDAFSRMVSHRLPLAEAQRGIDLMMSGQSIKVLLAPGERP